MTDLHHHFDQLTNAERHATDQAMQRVFTLLREEHGIRLTGDDRAERVADALARLVIESRTTERFDLVGDYPPTLEGGYFRSTADLLRQNVGEREMVPHYFLWDAELRFDIDNLHSFVFYVPQEERDGLHPFHEIEDVDIKLTQNGKVRLHFLRTHKDVATEQPIYLRLCARKENQDRAC